MPKVASSRLSQLVAHFHIFRLFMKKKFDAYYCDLWPKGSNLNSRLVYCCRLYGTQSCMKMLLVVQDSDFWADRAAREGLKISSVLQKSSTFEAFFIHLWAER